MTSGKPIFSLPSETADVAANCLAPNVIYWVFGLCLSPQNSMQLITAIPRPITAPKCNCHWQKKCTEHWNTAEYRDKKEDKKWKKNV